MTKELITACLTASRLKVVEKCKELSLLLKLDVAFRWCSFSRKGTVVLI